jgi:hypothetical protein
MVSYRYEGTRRARAKRATRPVEEKQQRALLEVEVDEWLQLDTSTAKLR